MIVDSIDCVIHVRVPERATVRVERHRAVITPTIDAAGLRAGTLDEKLLGLRQCVDRIGRQPSGVLHRRFGGAAGCTVADRHVARAIDRQTGHESVNDIRAVGIKSRRLRGSGRHCPAGHTDLVPARCREAAGIRPADRVSRPQRFDAAEICVLILRHRPNLEHIQIVSAL